MEPTGDDIADHGPEAAAQQRRSALWELHARLSNSQVQDLDEDGVEEIFTLTDDVLVLEARAVEHREREAHRHSSRTIYTAIGTRVLGSVTVLTLGIVFGWVSGWGIATLVITIVVGLVLAGAHAIAEPSGHRERVLRATLALVFGLVVAALVPTAPAWWVTLFALVLFLGIAVTFAATLRIEPPNSSGDEY